MSGTPFGHMAEVDEIKRSPTFLGSTETPYNRFYGWAHGHFGHIAKSGKIELRRLELHGCASHPPGRYDAQTAEVPSTATNVTVPGRSMP